MKYFSSIYNSKKQYRGSNGVELVFYEQSMRPYKSKYWFYMNNFHSKLGIENFTKEKGLGPKEGIIFMFIEVKNLFMIDVACFVYIMKKFW